MVQLFGKDVIDLEDTAQGFVLQTKQIHIPGFPGAFNPCIVRWHGSLLMSFRIRNEKMISTFEIGLIWLDKEFNPMGIPRILKISGDRSTFSQNQDPRLIVINNQLCIAYSNFIKIGQIVTRRMFLAPVLVESSGEFAVINPICLHPFEGWSSRWEKNWVPFDYDGNLLFAYSIAPHRIVQPSLDGACQSISWTHSAIHWKWGELRGGTPALLDGNEYIAFFHSSKKMATTHSQGKEMPHYFMGAYTFRATPPFEITRISPEPIVGKNFYNGPAYNTWKPLRVVFPMGIVIDSNYIWVSYGRQDFEIWVTKLDKKKLYESMIPCSQIIYKEFDRDALQLQMIQENRNLHERMQQNS